MGILDWFKRTSSGPVFSVGRLTTAQMSVDTTVDKNSPIYREERGYHRMDLASYRYSSDADSMLKLLSKIDPDVSAGIWNFLRLADSGVKAIGVDEAGRPNSQVQEQVDVLLRRIGGEDDYKNWKIRKDLPQLASQLLKYVLLRGACSSELVLGADRRALRAEVVDPVTVKFLHPAKDKFIPYQTDENGRDVKLDIPTFFWSVLDPDAGSPYETPPFLPVLQSVLFNLSLLQDLERIVKRVAFPRISVKILEDTLKKHAPPMVQADEAKMTTWLRDQRSQIASALSTLKPEEAAVFFDSMELGLLESKANATIDYRPLKEIIDQRIISGLKSLPTILGRQFGSSQTLSGVESLLYARSIKSLQNLVASQLSQMLTLALRLEGVAGRVLVKYGVVNLKPDNELEAFKTLKQARVLEMLSLGLITDEQAAEELTGDPWLPASYKPLSGTWFYKKNAALDANAVASTRNPTASEQAGGGRNK